MAILKEILDRKGSRIHTVEPGATALVAAKLMNVYHIGSLLVITDNRLTGIVTERDVLRRVVAEAKDPAETLVDEIMTRDVLTCRPDTPIARASAMMKTHKIRHLPVLDNQDQVVGMVSIGDINAYMLEGQATQIHFLEEYLYGTV